MSMTKKLKKGLLLAGDKVAGQAAVIVPQMRVELLQNRQAIVEGCKGVLEYSETCIRLSGDKVIVRFAGEGLLLKTFNSTSAIVEGHIASVEYM